MSRSHLLLLKRINLGSLAVSSLLVLLVTSTQPAHAQTETVLYSFAGPPNDGSTPNDGLVFDKEGNLYGTTRGGGAYDNGTVFKVSPSGAETVLHSFHADNVDGYLPEGGLVLDENGNLYGTTFVRGAYNSGTVFKMKTSGTETIRYSFAGYSDGGAPTGTLVFDKEGNVYGTTFYGGTDEIGTVFEVTPSGTHTVLHSFAGSDGTLPNAGLVLDAQRNLYGTTIEGGAYNKGTVFKLTPSGSFTVLYSFAGTPDGATPYALVLDKQGNLYGATNSGGATPDGTVFKVTPSGKEKVLYSFTGRADGGNPTNGALVFDKKGNLYGAASNTWTGYNPGTVFKITRKGVFKVLYTFGSQSADGAAPWLTLIFDKQGNLYGTTTGGGAYGYGTVFKVTPN